MVRRPSPTKPAEMGKQENLRNNQFRFIMSFNNLLPEGESDEKLPKTGEQ